MQKATSCSIGLLLVDASGSQFYSTLQPLTKEQKRAAAAAAAASTGKKQRGSGKGKATPGAAEAAAAAAPSPGAAAGRGSGSGTVVGLCLLPIHPPPGRAGPPPSRCMHVMPLTAGLYGGTSITSDTAAQGRHMVEQLLAGAPTTICWGMQGEHGSLLRPGRCRQSGEACIHTHAQPQPLISLWPPCRAATSAARPGCGGAAATGSAAD